MFERTVQLVKVLIDIAHPAHIHYFRNFASLGKEKGIECLFTLRDKGIIVELAKYYKLNYRIRSKKGNLKLLYAFVAVWNIFRIALNFKPDMFLDMGTVFASPVAFILRKPYIAFDDTEASTKTRLMHMPFTKILFTPDAFRIDYGKRHFRFKSLMELFYLHKNYFNPEQKLIEKYISDVENFVLVRFVSWEAHHDAGNKGISFENKIRLVNELSKKYTVVISFEGEIIPELEKFKIEFPSHLIHHVLAKARFVITEGATMASEAVVLGTPALYINSIQNGYSEEQSDKDLLIALKNDESIFKEVDKIENIVINQISEYKSAYQEYINSKIDATALLIWFVENYQGSWDVLQNNPEFQNNFR